MFSLFLPAGIVYFLICTVGGGFCLFMSELKKRECLIPMGQKQTVVVRQKDK